MRRLPIVLLAFTLFGCPPKPEHQAQLHVKCAANGKVLDDTASPPGDNKEFACPPGSNVELSYDNDGNYGYLTVFAVTRDNIVFFLPGSDAGQSVAITPGKNVPVQGTFVVPPKTRDIMALFTRNQLNARDVAQRTRDVTLAGIPGTEIRVRINRSYGPVD